MSSKEKNAVRLLDTKLDAKTTKTMVICAVIMLVSVLIHDGDHIRQAVNWGYTIPLSLWALNLIVYVLPVVSIFLAKSRRMSATLVSALRGIVTSLSFVVLHCFGSSSGLNWGIWNFTYLSLSRASGTTRATACNSIRASIPSAGSCSSTCRCSACPAPSSLSRSFSRSKRP